MRGWLESLGQQERLLVFAGGGLLVFILYYVLVWSPLSSGRAALEEQVAQQRETSVWMVQSAAQLQQLRRSSGALPQGLGGKSLLAVADSTARGGGLGDALKRVEPEGSDNVRVWLEGAGFDVLVKWLATLSTTYGIHAEAVTMERVENAPGRVNARLTLQAPAS